MTPYVGGRVAFVVSGNDGLVAVRGWGEEAWNPEDLVKHFDEFPSADVVFDAMHALDEAREQTAAHPLVANALPRFRSTALAAAEHLYLQWFLPGSKSETRAALVDALRDRGFAGQLADPGLLTVLGQTSIRCGCHVFQLPAAASAEGWDAEARITKLGRINDALRPLLRVNAFVVKPGRISSML
jgi:hypothetical protein